MSTFNKEQKWDLPLRFRPEIASKIPNSTTVNLFVRTFYPQDEARRSNFFFCIQTTCHPCKSCGIDFSSTTRSLTGICLLVGTSLRTFLPCFSIKISCQQELCDSWRPAVARLKVVFLMEVKGDPLRRSTCCFLALESCSTVGERKLTPMSIFFSKLQQKKIEQQRLLLRVLLPFRHSNKNFGW